MPERYIGESPFDQPEPPTDYTFGPNDLEGAYIRSVERRSETVWRIEFGFRGTDDGSGHMDVYASDIRFDGERI